MDFGFDFSTSDILDWELQAIFNAIDNDSIIFTRHAENELRLDALERNDVLDAIAFFDYVEKDLPDNSLGRVSGINFIVHSRIGGSYELKLVRVQEMGTI